MGLDRGDPQDTKAASAGWCLSMKRRYRHNKAAWLCFSRCNFRFPAGLSVHVKDFVSCGFIFFSVLQICQVRVSAQQKRARYLIVGGSAGLVH